MDIPNLIETGHVINVISNYIDANAGDDDTTDILVSMGADILDVSEDRFLKLLEGKA